MNQQTSLLFNYISDVLGVQQLPRFSADTANRPLSHVVWENPHFLPAVIFFNQDNETDVKSAATHDLFVKIVQALGLQPEQVWYVEAQGRSLMDFLNWLKGQNLISPLVVMKKEPDIQNFVQNAGSFNWVECFSLGMMLGKSSLKKPTWEVLKLLIGFK